MLNLRSNLYTQQQSLVDLPLYVYTAGTEIQQPITRVQGFSANQLLITFGGTGIFRILGQDKWDIIEENSLLYIPAELPHEYMPQDLEKSWQVGFVTFFEKQEGFLKGWGFGKSPYHQKLDSIATLNKHLQSIWNHTGPNYDAWSSTERLFSFLVEVKKQSASRNKPNYPKHLRNSVADNTIRFLHDYLQRDLTMTELASQLGYSPKQLTRLFREQYKVTPLQYLQHLRLQTAHLQLTENPDLSVRQAAAHIGMEPDYFTRLFKKIHGTVPSSMKTQKNKAPLN